MFHGEQFEAEGAADRWYVYRLTEAPSGFGYIVCKGKRLWECARETARRDRCAAIPLVWEGEARDADHALELAKQCELESPLRESLPT